MEEWQIWTGIGLYWWVTTMVGWWCWYPIVRDNWRSYEVELTTGLLSVFVTPFFFPLVIAYAIKNSRDKRKKELDRLRNEHVS